MAPYVDELRALSKSAFGQRYRLECMLAIARHDDGIVTLSGLAVVVGTSTSNVQEPLKSLVAIGLLSPLDSGDSRSRFYVRNPSPAWDWARELSRQAAEASGEAVDAQDEIPLRGDETR